MMLCNIKKRLKSKTYIWSALVGVIGILEVNYGLLRDMLGEHYGWSYMVIMLVGFLLREATTKSIQDK